MLTALVVALRSLALCCQGHRAVALENLALRQQLAVFKRTVKRPPLRSRDRLFWMLLANAGDSGAPPWSSCTPTRSCVGIANGSDAAGPDAHGGPVQAARARTRPFVPS